MFHFSIILIFLLMLVAGSTKSYAASPKCADLFSIDDDLQSSIEDLLAPEPTKRKLIKHAQYDKNFRKFIRDYLKLIVKIELKRKIYFGQRPADCRSFTFTEAV